MNGHQGNGLLVLPLATQNPDRISAPSGEIKRATVIPKQREKLSGTGIDWDPPNKGGFPGLAGGRIAQLRSADPYTSHPPKVCARGGCGGAPEEGKRWKRPGENR